jgi:hypothetical protein
LQGRDNGFFTIEVPKGYEKKGDAVKRRIKKKVSIKTFQWGQPFMDATFSISNFNSLSVPGNDIKGTTYHVLDSITSDVLIFHILIDSNYH